MANATNIADGDAAYDTLESKLYEVKANKVEIPVKITAGTAKINGMEMVSGDTVDASGKFAVKTVDTTTTVTFFAGDFADGDTVRVAYRRVIGDKANVMTVKTTSTTAKGALYAHWPVYSAGTDLNVRSFAA